jgi:hypothetical protein
MEIRGLGNGEIGILVGMEELTGLGVSSANDRGE